MKTVRLFFVFVCLALVGHRADARTVIHEGDAVIVPVRGEISRPLFLFLRRATKAAEQAHAAAIIFEMDTYGGELDAAEKITGVLNHANLPTYTFVNANAGSAGALIALATKHIYMAPVSAIGAAAPVLAGGEDLPSTMRDKTVSYWSALVRSSALRNGHNPDLGEAFMNKEKEVKIGEHTLHAKGSLLTLNAQDAAEKINGKPVLADGTADSIADLMKKAGLKGEAVALDPSGFEQVAFYITTLAPLLLLGGIIGAYLEFKIPGTSVPGTIGALCFALFFLGHYLAGLAGWEVVALFIFGVLFVLVEILFFAHSTIVFGVIGVFLMLGSLLWAMIDRYPGETFFPTGAMLAVPVLNLLLTLAAAGVVIAILARYLPQTSLYRRFVLASTSAPGTSLASAPREFETSVPLAPGVAGISLTMLRPSGKARIADRLVDVVTEGEFIAPETSVTVVSADGMRVVVRGT